MAVRRKGLATFSESGSTRIPSNRAESVGAPSAESRVQQAVDLRLELRNPLYFLSEFDELHRCLREAESIAQRISDDRRLGRVINFLNSYYGLMGEHHRSIEFGTRGLRINRDDVELNTVTHYYMGLAYHHIGRYDHLIAFLRRALSIIQEERFKYERFGTAFVLSVICRSWLAQCCAPARALQRRKNPGRGSDNDR
jgi:tetratricopeptide (TPR) repeat protein